MIIGEYSPRRSRGEYSPIITEPEANNCFSIFVFFGTEFILILLISLSVYNFHITASRHFENVGKNLCKNTKVKYDPVSLYGCMGHCTSPYRAPHKYNAALNPLQEPYNAYSRLRYIIAITL